MTKLTPRSLTLTLAALSLPLAAAQTMKPLGFAFGKDAGMNMMMSGESIDISAYPGAKLLLNKMSGNTATLVYAGNDARAVFAFYDKAILAEGWKSSQAMLKSDSMGAGAKMNGSSMAGASMTGKDSVAGDKMMADTMATTADYTLKDHKLSLNVKASAGRVTVNFVSK